MLSLDQVRLLENRVEKAVHKIQSLVSENSHLRNQLTSVQTRINELEGLVRAFKDDQSRIEEGIINALDRLSEFEESSLSLDDTNTTHEVVQKPTSDAEDILIEAIDDEDDTSQLSEQNTDSNGQIDIF